MKITFFLFLFHRFTFINYPRLSFPLVPLTYWLNKFQFQFDLKRNVFFFLLLCLQIIVLFIRCDKHKAHPFFLNLDFIRLQLLKFIWIFIVICYLIGIDFCPKARRAFETLGFRLFWGARLLGCRLFSISGHFSQVKGCLDIFDR